MTLPQAIGASCDTYFYNLGYSFYALPPDRGHPLQGWASRFGFGAPTGVDVGPEQDGLLPTPEWRQSTYTKKTDPCCWQIDRLWKPGDSIQLAIGQKDLLVTPLQMVRFYSLIANGGKLVKPHVVQAVGKPGGGMVPLNPPAPEPSNVDPAALAVVRDGLYRATHASYGTATAVFGNFPISVAGKTGTAEKVVQPPGYAHPLLQDQSWWCGYAPAEKPELAVCAVIENGGHGGTAAAPAALKVFEHYFHKHCAARSGRSTPTDGRHLHPHREIPRTGRVAAGWSRKPRCSRVSTGSCSALSSCSSRTACGRSRGSRSTMCSAAPTTTSTGRSSSSRSARSGWCSRS